MLTKILFTLAVVVGVLAWFRWRRQGRVLALPASPRPASKASTRPVVKWLAIAVAGLSIAGAALWLVHAWRDAAEVITVQVFDARSGAMNEYQAYRSDLDLEERSFRTGDGRRVTLAETERIETLPGD